MATRKSRSRRTPRKPRIHHSFPPMPWWELMEHITGKSEADLDDDWLSDLVHEDVMTFMRDYLPDDPDSPEVRHQEEIQEAVRDLCWNNATADLARARQRAIASAIEEILREGEVECTVDDTDERKGLIEVTVKIDDMMRMWARETEGMGLVAWDPTLRISDIEGLGMLCNILDHYAEVYGIHGLKIRYQRDMEGFQPTSGSYWQSRKVADEIVKKLEG